MSFITVPSSGAGAAGVLNGMTLHTYWKSNSTTKHRKKIEPDRWMTFSPPFWTMWRNLFTKLIVHPGKIIVWTIIHKNPWLPATHFDGPKKDQG